jgi:valyl-tRNA synthetase
VYLHGTARDIEGRKMSKSLGNGIDPLDVVRLYGADALRWTLVAGMGLGTDVHLDPADLDKSFAPGRNFATKLWNIGRFLLTNVGAEPVRAVDEIPADRLGRADAWILERLDQAIRDCDLALGPIAPSTPGPEGNAWRPEERYAGLRLNELAEAARRFVWNELADWYLEAAKSRLQTPGEDREVARAVLAHCFDRALRLLHPIVPFITESLWQRLPGRDEGELLVRASWPRVRDDAAISATGERAREFELVREAVTSLRQLRADYGVQPGKFVDVVIAAEPDATSRGVLVEEFPTIGRLARATLLERDATPGEAAAHALLSGGASLVLPLAGLVDLEKECARLRGELAGLEKQLGALEGRLANEGFVSRAPAHVVEAERKKLDEWRARRDQLTDKVRSLCGG